MKKEDEENDEFNKRINEAVHQLLLSMDAEAVEALNEKENQVDLGFGFKVGTYYHDPIDPYDFFILEYAKSIFEFHEMIQGTDVSSPRFEYDELNHQSLSEFDPVLLRRIKEASTGVLAATTGEDWFGVHYSDERKQEIIDSHHNNADDFLKELVLKYFDLTEKELSFLMLNKRRMNQEQERIELYSIINRNEEVIVNAKHRQTTDVIEGKVLQVDASTNMMMIETPEGDEKIISVLDYIVTVVEAVKFVIPIVTPLIRFFKKLFRRRK